MKLSKELLFLVQCIPRALLLLVLLICSFLFIKENRSCIKERIIAVVKRGWLFVFLLYVSLILTSAVFAREVTEPYSNILDNFGFYDEEGINTELIINILVFIPYTFLFLQAFKLEKPFRSAIVLSIVTTSFIELAQLVFWLGKFQFSDIVHNTLGGLLGYGLWNGIQILKERREKN